MQAQAFRVADSPSGVDRAGKVPGTVANPWGQDQLQQKYPTLTTDITTDVCVVGAGLAGLTTAYRLIKAGKTVVVLESRVRGAGDTGRSLGVMSTWHDAGIHSLESVAGGRNTRTMAEAHRAAIEYVRHVVKEEGIAAGFEQVPGYLLGAKPDTMDKELEACKRVGIDAQSGSLGIGLGRASPAGEQESSATGSTAAPALVFDNCAVIDPVKYIDGLADAVTKHGGQIFESTRAKAGLATGPSKGRVQTLNGHTVTAKEGVVLATRSPINRDQLWVHDRQLPQRLYCLALEAPPGYVPAGQFFDTSGSHSVMARLARMSSGRALLLVQGEGHKYGLGESKYVEREPWGVLELWAKSHFPGVGSVSHRWTTMSYFPADLLGLYGQDPFDFATPPNYILTGHGNQEWTGATLGADIVASSILGEPCPWADTYKPSRVWAGATKKYASELTAYFSTVGVALLKHVVPRSLEDVRGLFSPSSVEKAVARGEGAVVQHGWRKKAMYRDLEGTLHVRSALCTHLGCCVSWNARDKTFDCPCHGSQYDTCGRCIHAPAVGDLEDLGNKR